MNRRPSSATLRNIVRLPIATAIVATLLILFAGAASAQALLHDWDTLTWTPEGQANLSQTYPLGVGSVQFTFSGNTPALFDPMVAGVSSPGVNMINTGGRNPPERSLYFATDYPDQSDPAVTLTVDFLGYPAGVTNVTFRVFDLDAAIGFHDDIIVTAETPLGTVDPTNIVPGAVNEILDPNNVSGIPGTGSASNSADGNVRITFGQLGITRITIVYRNIIGQANPGFASVSIHDFGFVDPGVADLSLTKTSNNPNPSIGDPITFTLTVANDGPDNATGVVVNDRLPAGFSYVGDDSGGAYDPATGDWLAGAIPVGGTAVLNIVATVNATGPWTNIAEVTDTDQSDPDSFPNNGDPNEDDYAESSAPPGAPPDAVDDTDRTDPDIPVDIPVLGNDSDPNNSPLEIVAATDPANGSIAIDDNGTPADTTDDFIVYTPDPGFEGIDNFTYTIANANGGTDTATVTVIVGPDAVDITKTASPDTVVAGSLVTYTVTIENVGATDLANVQVRDTQPAGFSYVAGSARVDGNPAAVTVSGARPVLFDNIAVSRFNTVTLTYMMNVGAGVVAGQHRNTAEPLFNGVAVGAPASAVVTVIDDPDFDQTTIIGKVFNDIDADGFQDDDESGIPGVRLATVEGLLIETDAHGRFHVAGVDGGLMERGRNYIMKVDPATLPPGAVFTTENPRVLRITRGLVNRINFGVRLASDDPCCDVAEIKLSEIFFTEGSDDVRTEYLRVLTEFAERLRLRGGGMITIEGNAERNEVDVSSNRVDRDLAERRAVKVYLALKSLLGERLVQEVDFRVVRPTDIETPMAQQGQVCGEEDCTNPRAYKFDLVTREAPRALTPGDSSYARANNSRVDVTGRFLLNLTGRAKVWATEDASEMTPRLAALCPDELSIRNGRVDSSATFYVYNNYAAFMDRVELLVYRRSDEDRVAPLTTLSVPLQPWSSVTQSAGMSGQFRDGDELVCFLRAYDAQGRFDETEPQTVYLRATDATGDLSSRRLTRKVSDPGPDGGARPATPKMSPGKTPLDGNLLVFRPPGTEVERQRQEYTLAPRFRTRKWDLSARDMAELDRIAAQWRGADNIEIRAAGHTDNVRIAPQNRHEVKDNQELSENRARSVARYVARALGVPASSVRTSGHADTDPVASNGTAAGRARNRRVELHVTGERVTRRQNTIADIRLIDPASARDEPVEFSISEAETFLKLKSEIDKTEPSGTAVKRSTPSTLAAGPLSVQNDADALAAIYGRDQLVLQNIPLYGSRVRVYGQDIDDNEGLLIDGVALPLDPDGLYTAEYLMPIGQHRFRVALTDAGGATRETAEMPVDVTGEHMFIVGLADLTVSDNEVTGNIEPLAADSRYAEDFLAEGRLALYLKGRIKGKYLVTAQLDTDKEQIDDLFDTIDDKDPRDVFRRLDPDRYYPVYGDDSTTQNDTDSQGKMYVRVDWNRSEARWGNYHTGITGNEFAQYNRSLYGGRYRHRSMTTTDLGETKVDAQVFVAEAQTALGHSEFLGTGGSLYYLKHRDVLPGSDKIHVEVRDRDSARVIENLTLERGLDYEIDEMQGRIILARPLAQVTELLGPSLIRDTALDGNDVVLLVDYEYVPDGFRADHVVVGGRGKYWINDRFAVGGTYVDEDQGDDNYRLGGADLTWQLARGTYVKAEYATTDRSQSERWFSNDGGMSFSGGATPGTGRDGDAIGVEARINTREVMKTENEWIGAGWWRTTDPGFSVARRDLGVETTEFGGEVTGTVGPFDVAARASVVERDLLVEQTRVGLQAGYALGERIEISGEVRHVSDDYDAAVTVPGVREDNDALLGALRLSYRLFDNTQVYAIGQYTASNDNGRYDNNDMGTVGVRLRLSNHTDLDASFSSGHRGDSARLGVETVVNDNHRVYGTYTHSTDRTDPFMGSHVTVGHRSRISNQTSVFNEMQFVEQDEHAGIGHVFGMDFEPRAGINVGLTLQTGILEGVTGRIDRDAASVTAGLHSDRFSWRSKIEYRNDNGASDRRQWLSTNRADYKFSDAFRLLTRFNWADTENQVQTATDAKFVEAGVGVAYRPVTNDQFNVLAKYTFLYDLAGLQQIDTGADQRSQIGSIEGTWGLGQRWELGGKIARRIGELRERRDDGQWFDSTVDFGAVRLRYHMLRSWDGMVEYRILDVEETASTRRGLMAEIQRHFGNNLRLGIGYNFTDFSDDLGDTSYDHKGWFLNALGKY